MKHHHLAFGRLCVLLAAAVSSGGCIVTVEPDPTPTPTPVTIELVNETGFVIDANFFANASATDASGLFIAGNIFTGYSDKAIPTMGAGQTVSFELACDAVRSLGVRRPVFVNTLEFTGGESADEVFLLLDAHYQCGDTIRFIYFRDGETFHVGRG